jgi:hypothetical protein
LKTKVGPLTIDTLGPVVAFPWSLAKQAKLVGTDSQQVGSSLLDTNVFDLQITFNTLKDWNFEYLEEEQQVAKPDFECTEN